MAKLNKKYTFRKLINDVHLWLGLPSALILFVMCFTGTMYVFSKEITQLIDSNQFAVKVPANANVLPIAKLIQRIEKEHKGKVTSITIPVTKSEAWLVVLTPNTKNEAVTQIRPFTKPKEKAVTVGKKTEKEVTEGYLVNPYTGASQGSAQTATSEFFATTLKLHRWLLLDKSVGSVLTGVAALLMKLFKLSVSG